LFGSDNVALREAFLQWDFAGFPLRDWILALSSWTLGLLFLGVLYTGVWVLLKHTELWNADMALLVLTAAYVVLVSSGPEAYSRFRMPVMPIFCVLAAGGYLCREGKCDERERGAEINPGPANVAVAVPRMSGGNS
jgi:hypothetical protein